MRERAERDNFDAGFFREQVEGVGGGGPRGGHGDTGEAAKANGARRLQVEIVLRQEDAGAGFSDKGRGVDKAAESGIELKAVASGDPNAGNGFAGEILEKVGEAKERFSGERDEIVDSAVNDGGGRAHAWWDCSGKQGQGRMKRDPSLRLLAAGRLGMTAI